MLWYALGCYNERESNEILWDSFTVVWDFTAMEWDLKAMQWWLYDLIKDMLERTCFDNKNKTKRIFWQDQVVFFSVEFTKISSQREGCFPRTIQKKSLKTTKQNYFQK